MYKRQVHIYGPSHSRRYHLSKLYIVNVMSIVTTIQTFYYESLLISDDPHLVSSKHKDVFEDILEDRRHSSDMRYSTRTRDVLKFRLNKQRTPQQLKEHVLKSDRVQYAVEQVSVSVCFSLCTGVNLFCLICDLA